MANQIKYKDKILYVGQILKVHYKLIEKEKVAGRAKREVKEEIRERIQIFEGILIAIKGSGENRMITVRRIGTAKIGIERIFPLNSPWIKNITGGKIGKVRRAKLYYLRIKLGKEREKLQEKETQVVKKTSRKNVNKKQKSVENKQGKTKSGEKSDK